MNTAAVFVEAARMRTLPAAAAPALLGVALAVGSGTFHLVAAVCAVLGAIAIQIGTNYANDYFDFKNGADTEHRVGPRRATQAGLVAPSTMRAAFIIAFAVAVAFGVYLVVRGGWPIVAVGVASVICGILYTGGPKPLGYLGLGDVLVLIFFGPVAVAGTVYVQSLQLDWTAVVVGLSPGLLSTAILVVNNLRGALRRKGGAHRIHGLRRRRPGVADRRRCAAGSVRDLARSARGADGDGYDPRGLDHRWPGVESVVGWHREAAVVDDAAARGRLARGMSR